MKIITKQMILESIGRVYEDSKKCQLGESFFGTIDDDLEVLSNYFKTTKNQAFFISVVFVLNYKGKSIDLNVLIDYFACNPMKMLAYSEDLDYLFSKRIFKNKNSKYRLKLESANDEFIIHQKINEAILQVKDIPKVDPIKINDTVGLLEGLHYLGQQRNDDKISTVELFEQIDELISENEHFPLIEKIKQFQFSIEDTYVFLGLIWKTLSGKESIDIGEALEEIYDDPSERVGYMRGFLSEDNVLVKNDLIEIIEPRFFRDTEMKLTNRSENMLNECDIKLFLNKKKKDTLIFPSDIDYRELIFDPLEMNQIVILGDLLQDKKFKEVQNRLIDKGLPKGVTILLHGAPGTGKTEIVKQLAKKTDREIIKVDISQTRSKWFGESEKIIKRIFTDYRSYAKDCDRTPILLFNEADAIISKRKEVGSSSVAQVENTIQNIILEELENFDGILMATTNLVNNLDTAFERRFLFKILFRNPSISIRAKIWKSKLPLLEDSECQLMAEKFEFSGGQIDNIVRKTEIREIVEGTVNSFGDIWSFCNEESMAAKEVQIGFIKY